MTWQDELRGDPLPWLLEPDEANPGVRFFALRDLLGRSDDDAEVVAARRAVMTGGPVPAILDAMYPEGYWVKPGGGYSPKYRSTVWQILLLAELGADPADERVRQGCEYLLSHSLAGNGAFAAGTNPTPSRAIHCLNGNLLAALLQLGFGADPRVQAAMDWLVHSITGEEPISYFAWGTCGPGFACGINEKQPCAWGATKAMRALLAVPLQQRTPTMQRAVALGARFLLSRDPSIADYPYSGKVSSTWFKLGFPLSYWSDVLEVLEVLVNAGYGDDRRLANAFEFLLSRQDRQGRWTLANSLNGKMWTDVERRGKPSKWVTLRALRTLKGRSPTS